VKYTVVGLYPDTDAPTSLRTGQTEETYVEWVEADTPEEAATLAADEELGRTPTGVVAIFEGHLLDVGPHSDYGGETCPSTS